MESLSLTKARSKSLKVDLIKNFFVVFVVNLLNYYKSSQSGKTPASLIDENFITSTGFLLLAFVVYHYTIADTVEAFTSDLDDSPRP